MLCGIIHFAAKPEWRTPDVSTEFKRQMRAALESAESELRYVLMQATCEIFADGCAGRERCAANCTSSINS